MKPDEGLAVGVGVGRVLYAKEKTVFLFMNDLWASTLDAFDCYVTERKH